MSQPPRIAIPPINLGFGLVGKVDPTLPEGTQVEVKPANKTMLLGQVYLAFSEPMKALLPMKVIAPQAVGPMVLAPLTERWFCDSCAECRKELLKVLCRTKGVQIGEVSTGALQQAQGGTTAPEVEQVDVGPAPASPVPYLRVVENNNDNSPSEN